MCELTSVFEVRSGMCSEPGDGDHEGGMFSSFELAKSHANQVIESLSCFNNMRWVSNHRAENHYCWVHIYEYDVIYPEQELSE